MFWSKKDKPVENKTALKAEIKVIPEEPVKGGVINFEDFAKVDLRLGKILEASRVEGSEKLLKLKVDFGSEDRQILAGIGKVYAPEFLIGRSASFVFNLAPRKMMGLESQGMILAVSDENGLSILSPDKEIKPGSKLS